MSVVQPGPARAGRAQWSSEPLRYLMRIYLAFLREVFKTAPKDGYYFNDNDPAASRVMITSDVPVDAEQINARPHIVPFFSGIQWNGIGLDQLKNESLMNGGRTHADRISGNLSVSVLSRNGDEATFICFHIANFTWLLRRVLMKAAFQEIGQRPSMTAPTPPGHLVANDSAGEIIAVTALLGFEFAWVAKVNELNNYMMQKMDILLETETPSPVNVPSHTVPMVGSATKSADGGRPRIGASPTQGIFLNSSERDNFVVVGSVSDEGPQSAPITRRLVLGEE